MKAKAVSKHMQRVAALPCCLCGAMPVELHHIREGQGASQRAGDMLVIPLCPACHRGPKGVHGDKTMLRIRKASEMDLLNETLTKVFA
ncbi:DUF968 domain-containing protein [Pseudomethylobacillus aquaticus]|uniref:DUF968 domain-containing protein n=1 Tax=Pseudomethylobacillus aquaticus TaxID=2676064 RepID=A0A3N0V6J4_9PROT|nr:DUF968 domain-containing protein [Pseudomethylobacillus aquaticus]ROH87988.1 DUF968 domain-containing protein [Pseudomethylobacillus aquaticus]